MALILKTTACGPTWWVARHDPSLKADQFLHYIPVLSFELLRQGYVAMLIGETTCIHYLESAGRQEQEAGDISIFDERLSDVIDTPPTVFSAWVRKECNPIEAKHSRGYINEGAFWIAPDGVKFGLNENAGPLPDCPPQNLFASVRGNMLWNDRETFILWLAREWLTLNGDKVLAWDDRATKFLNMQSLNSSRAEHFQGTSNV